MQRQPTLLNSCALAATAAEARFRIDYPDPVTRSSRVVALDDGAAAIVGRLASRHWSGGHFLVFEAVIPVNGSGVEQLDATMRTADGAAVLLSDELDGADVAVMIATDGADSEAASLIGDACATRRIMTAGLIVSDGRGDNAAVASLRPNAMVLTVLSDEADVLPILTALRV